MARRAPTGNGFDRPGNKRVSVGEWNLYFADDLEHARLETSDKLVAFCEAWGLDDAVAHRLMERLERDLSHEVGTCINCRRPVAQCSCRDSSP